MAKTKKITQLSVQAVIRSLTEQESEDIVVLHQAGENKKILLKHSMGHFCPFGYCIMYT